MGLCDQCFYKEICTPHAQELAKKRECENYEEQDYSRLDEYTDLDDLGQVSLDGENYWLEMSWHKYGSKKS